MIIRENLQIKEAYKQFCLAEGNQHIASEFALLKLQKLVRNFQVKNVLEIGLGIGSIAGILLALNKNLDYSGTEANEFCLKALGDNLKSANPRLKIYNSLNELSREQKFELIIIDGNDPDLNLTKGLISINGIIAVEGDRMPQQVILREIFPEHKYVHSISLSKNKNYSPFPSEEWQGGLKIIFVNPTLKQYCWWFKEKIRTKMKYKYPGRYLGSVTL